MELDKIDLKLLDYVQSNLPIEDNIYALVGEHLGILEDEVILRLQKLIDMGIIRRLGAVFDSRKLGYTGTLCAMKVPKEKIAEVAKVIDTYQGITHNYLRDHSYNMWFTLLAPNSHVVENILTQIKDKTGIEEILELPAENIFKIKVNFNLT